MKNIHVGNLDLKTTAESLRSFFEPVRTQNGKSILLAEDERPLRTLLLRILRAAGYNVIVAADGRDGLKKSRQFNGTIHLLLSDVEMPNMTGIELATQIQIDRPGIPVLLMSGMESGMVLLNESWQFLPKPFTSDLLNERVRHLLLQVSAKAELNGA